MARETTYSGILGDLQRLLVKIEANIAQLPQLEPFRAKLAAMLVQVLEINKQQDFLRAGKQEASKQMKLLVVECQRLASVIRSVIKEHYGIREEKIAEFGLQPFRGRKAKAPQAPETPELPEAPDPIAVPEQSSL
jgi:hypothetical protein